MFTITTGYQSHFLDGGLVPGTEADRAMVEVYVDPSSTDRYKFASFLCRNDSAYQLVTLEQLNSMRATLGADKVDPRLGRDIFVVEWSAPATRAHATCQQIIAHMRALLTLGIFDLPETF